MNDTDPHTLTGAYAANALPPDEEAAFDAHVRQCPSCAQEVRELLATTARLAAAVPEHAPRGLRERVLAQAQTTRQLSPLDHPILLDDARRTHIRGRRGWSQNVFAVAASLLVALSVGLGIVAVQTDRRAEEAARIAAVATDPRAATMTGSLRGATAKVIAARGAAVFSVRDLRDPGEGRDYQLWVIGEEGSASPRSVGVLDRGSGGRSEHFISDVDPGETIAVTIEPAGGSAEPTTSPLMQVRVEA